jgi:hypothetical protein
MCRAWFAVAVLTILPGVAELQGGTGKARAAEPEKKSPTPSAAAELSVGEPIRYENLTIFPVTTHTLRDADRFITLDEGLKSGTVEILEAGAVAQAGASPETAANGPANAAANAAPNAAANDDPLFAEPPVQIPLPPQARQQPPAPRSNATTPRRPAAMPRQQAATPQRQPTARQPSEQQATAREPRVNPQTLQAANQSGAQAVAQTLATGNDVNKLFVLNRSEKPLYLMPGEIMIGGAQDRAIGHEYVIQPSSKPQPIAVFCVEHGRWGTRSQAELATSLVIAGGNIERGASLAVNAGDAAELAQQANQGKFIGSVGRLNKGPQLALQEGQGQGAVWNQVGRENAKSSVKSGSGAFTGQYAEKEAVERLDPYISKLQAPIAGQANVVGILVAVNGKMDSAEILESTPLFKKLWPKLLKSYALEAANAKAKPVEMAMKKDPAEKSDGKQDETPAKPAQPQQPCTRDDAIAFLGELQKVDGHVAKVEGGLAVSRHIGSRLSTCNAYDPKAAPADARLGGFGGGIHSQGFAK